MVDEELGEYLIILEDGTQLKSSRDYTGKATATYPNAEVYEGYFKDGIKNGHGKYSYRNGDVYEGEFKDNLKNGIGKMTYSEKGEYHGYFSKGKRHGQGVFKYLNGDIYSGEWKEGKKEGKGTYVVRESEMKIKGEWSDGKVVKGKWLFPNGTYFEGIFDNNKPKGKGQWNFSNGNLVRGEYCQTSIPGETEEELLNPAIKLSWASSS